MFFKQKTAYEMRISDWSSDVCSSDLPKALGLKAGEEMIVREERGKFEFEPVEDEARRIDLTGVYGSHPGLKPVERLPMEPRELDREGKLLRQIGRAHV